LRPPSPPSPSDVAGDEEAPQEANNDLPPLADENLQEMRKLLLEVLYKTPAGKVGMGDLGAKNSEIFHAAERWAKAEGKSIRRGHVVRAVLAIMKAEGDKALFYLDRTDATNPKIILL
jgi:hypothetical protein